MSGFPIGFRTNGQAGFSRFLRLEGCRTKNAVVEVSSIADGPRLQQSDTAICEKGTLMRLVFVGTFALAALTAIGPVHAAEGLDRAIAAIEAYDYPRALPPLREAAMHGDRRAQRLLGFMLLHGEQLYRGISADPAEAMAWLRKASAQGDEQAAWAVARLERSQVATTAPR